MTKRRRKVVVANPEGDPYYRRLVVGVGASLLFAMVGCAPDGPDTLEGARKVLMPIEVDVFEEARIHNGGEVFEFVVDEDRYVSAPTMLPAGEVMLTITYVGKTPGPHSLVLEGYNNNQPVVAIDAPGSNNGVVTVRPGRLVYFDGAPGNRQSGYEGRLHVTGRNAPTPVASPRSLLEWTTSGLEFTSAPRSASSSVSVLMRLVVSDAEPHSVAFERVRDGHPLVAVDGPGENQRFIDLPMGTYIYFCAVPGHREAGMEGLLLVGS